MSRKLLADEAAIQRFRRGLLEWYTANKRQMVWRDSPDPYRIWLSEIMLQQTRVEQMGAYFERFVAAFPTVEDLAAASEDRVLKAWEGLGYYARARNLHKAAKEVVGRHGGRMPDTYEELLDLPGVGLYTAAAISSIAFGRDQAAVDGNVIRVLARVLRLEDDSAKAGTKAQVQEAAQSLLEPGRAGDFNQAMMELGARVCTPKSPACTGCPVGELCRARAELDDPSVLPRKAPKKKRPHYQVAAGMIWKGEKLLVAQRLSDGLLGGMWEFPGGKQEEGESLEECLRREIAEELDFAIGVEELLVQVEHAYTHFSITLHAFKARYLSGQPRAVECADWRWIDPAELDDFAFSRADRKVIEYLRQPSHQLELFTGA
jgi:A/G-specific adenine glycosylase